MWCLGKSLVIFLIFMASGLSLRSHPVFSENEISTAEAGMVATAPLDSTQFFVLLSDTIPGIQRGTRFFAIGLNIALGLFGLHRVFLGTDVIVPIFYTFTLGGGGILWLADLVMLIVKKDYSAFTDNPHLIMFLKSEMTPVTNNY